MAFASSLDLLRGAVEVGRREVAAVARDPRDELGLLHLGGGQVPAVLHHPLHHRAELRHGCIGLFESEDPHPPMIIRPCARVKGMRSTSTSGAARRSGSRRSSRSSSSSRTGIRTPIAGTRHGCTTSATSPTSGRDGTATSFSASRSTATTTRPRPSLPCTPRSSRSSAASSSVTTSSRAWSSRCSAASAPSCSSTGSPRTGWARTGRRGACCTSQSFRWRSSCRPCTASRSSCCSRSPRSHLRSAAASPARASSPASRS